MLLFYSNVSNFTQNVMKVFQLAQIWWRLLELSHDSSLLKGSVYFAVRGRKNGKIVSDYFALVWKIDTTSLTLHVNAAVYFAQILKIFAQIMVNFSALGMRPHPLHRRPEHASFIRASPPVLTRKGWYCSVTNNTNKVFWVKTNLLKPGNDKHLKYSMGSLTIFECKIRQLSKRCQHFQCPCISSWKL